MLEQEVSWSMKCRLQYQMGCSESDIWVDLKVTKLLVKKSGEELTRVTAKEKALK